MRIIGIDPGYAIVGFSILEIDNFKEIDNSDNFVLFNKPTLISYGVIRTDSSLEWERRFIEIFGNLQQIIEKYKPEIASIEKVFFKSNHKTVMQISEIRGALNLFFLIRNIDVYNFTPLEIKKIITSNGRAKKKEVQLFLKEYFNLEEIPQPDDASDAIATALALLFNIQNLKRLKV